MTELTKLEAGKTYVFKDDETKQAYLCGSYKNLEYFKNRYSEGFILEYVNNYSSGIIDGESVIGADELHLFKLKEEPMQNIKPEDEVTITTTYGELARVYAVLGNVNGLGYGEHLWHQLVEILDPEEKVYNGLVCSKKEEELMDYASYQKEWLNALFPQETDQQKQIRELREQAKELLKKAKQLEESV